MGMLAQAKVGRVFPSTAKADHVHVDHVSQFLLKCVSQPSNIGEVPVVLATGNCAIRVAEYKHRLMGETGCSSLFLDATKKRYRLLMRCLRCLELAVYKLMLGPKVSHIIGSVYTVSYTHLTLPTIYSV
eukprot:TRINITY_DN1763_c0_g1_i13.p1 TRINITY_DN1763_c0_g1~~TRINITY_DN1763_c0_g1_i13.p1  ORF type:complete len:129 (+),score=22.74 TRINITY_DN1763_c0_g1_i13:164-550(+)